MAQVLIVNPHCRALARPSRSPPPPRHTTKPSPLPPLYGSFAALHGNPSSTWTALLAELKCEGRHSCFFADGRKQDQARKSLESALGGKKAEFEKWNKEIEKREEMGRGGTSGRGGWFGGGGWFGWFGGDHFWDEAQQAILTILGIISLFLLITKGNTMFAVIFNPLLFVLRGARNWFTFLSSSLSRRTSEAGFGTGTGSGSGQMESGAYQPQMTMSAKERVVKKWGTD